MNEVERVTSRLTVTETGRETDGYTERGGKW